jgi:hypothetical protein
MNKKYQRYIDYIVSDIEAPYFENMRDMYGLKDSEYSLVLSKVYNQSVTIRGHYVYNTNGNEIYREDSDGYWIKREYNTNDNQIYFEDSDGNWKKREYDNNGNIIYYENSNGRWYKYEYDANGDEIYNVDNSGYISDNR